MTEKKETKEETLDVDVKKYIPTPKVPILKKETEGSVLIKGRLISRLIFPVVISYGKENLILPPKGNVPVNKMFLGELPKGIVFIKTSN